MKKMYLLMLIMIVIGLAIFTLWLQDKETTFNEEFPIVVELEDITEIKVVRGSDDAEVNISDSARMREVYENLFNSSVKRAENDTNKEEYESYWITIRSDKGREFGFRIDSKLNVSTHDYREDKSSSTNYVFIDDKALKSIESLLQ